MAAYDTREKVAALATIDPELEAVLKQHPFPAPDWSKLPEMRIMRQQLELSRAATPEQAKFESTIKVTMRDGFESELRVHRPANPPQSSPLIGLFFGGGFTFGSNLQLGPYARALAALLGATVVTFSYRLAPEHKFPTQIHDALDSFKWLAANAESLGADPSAGFIIGGVSAGGNLAANVVQAAVKEKITPAVTGAWICIPIVLGESIVPDEYRELWFSRSQNAEAPVFNQAAIDKVGEYMQMDEKSELWSPFNVADAHKGFPPTYVQVCGMDPLRDDGLIYEKVLRENGVTTRLDVYPGVPHAHFSFLPTLKQSKKATVDIIQNIAHLLGQEVSVEAIAKVVAPPAGA